MKFLTLLAGVVFSLVAIAPARALDMEIKDRVSGLTGALCQYSYSENGDFPNNVAILVGEELRSFEAIMDDPGEFNDLNDMAVGTPVEFDVVYREYYDEPGGETVKKPGITKIQATGPPEPQVCQGRLPLADE
ncbi:MAG: hypothetical protein LBR11_09095 [Deltaproteobacteria bacterium]|nr:hypothetical protein [Deltaproteobacteria bacterium]